MRFVPSDRAGEEPNIIVDGAATRNTLLALSHWSKSGTPQELKCDTSAEIVYAYLDSPRFYAAAAVSNNHFDEDGLVGIFALLNPVLAAKHRDLLIDVATAGDFGRYRDRDADRFCVGGLCRSRYFTAPATAHKHFQLQDRVARRR